VALPAHRHMPSLPAVGEDENSMHEIAGGTKNLDALKRARRGSVAARLVAERSAAERAVDEERTAAEKAMLKRAAAEREQMEAQLQHSLRCPITHELYADPVVASDGHTYEREAIEAAWRSAREMADARQAGTVDDVCCGCSGDGAAGFRRLSPVTGEEVTTVLTTNFAIIQMIECLHGSGAISAADAADWCERRAHVHKQSAGTGASPSSAPSGSFVGATPAEASQAAGAGATDSTARRRRSSSFERARRAACSTAGRAMSAGVETTSSALRTASQVPSRLSRTTTSLFNEAATRASLSATKTVGDFRICPNCKNGIFKNDGCDHMTCLCGHEFCWRCSAPYRGARGIMTVGNSAHKRWCKHHRHG